MRQNVSILADNTQELQVWEVGTSSSSSTAPGIYKEPTATPAPEIQASLGALAPFFNRAFEDGVINTNAGWIITNDRQAVFVESRVRGLTHPGLLGQRANDDRILNPSSDAHQPAVPVRGLTHPGSPR